MVKGGPCRRVGQGFGSRIINGLPEPASQKLVLGYYTEDYPGDRDSYNSLSRNSQLIDLVATIDYHILPDGNPGYLMVTFLLT